MRAIAPERVSARLFARAARAESGCLISGYSVREDDGYSQIGWQECGKRLMMLAHRVAWAAVNGPIPDGMTVDHRCHVRQCIEPTHLRLLTHPANSARWDEQDWPVEWACKRNHDISERFVNANGYEECRACRRITFNEWQRANRAAKRQALIDAGLYRKPGRPRRAA